MIEGNRDWSFIVISFSEDVKMLLWKAAQKYLKETECSPHWLTIKDGNFVFATFSTLFSPSTWKSQMPLEKALEEKKERQNNQWTPKKIHRRARSYTQSRLHLQRKDCKWKLGKLDLIFRKYKNKEQIPNSGTQLISLAKPLNMMSNKLVPILP